MAYSSCAGTFAANIAKDCSAPLTGGWTGRAILIDLADISAITRSLTNPRIITGITLASGKKVCVLDNAFSPQPMNGSNKQSNTDDGMMKTRKTIVFAVPLRGAGASKDIVEPTYQSPLGYLCIGEKKDMNGDGSFEVIGSEQGLVANADGIAQNEYENGGCPMITMSCNEVYYEHTLFDTNYASTKAIFDTLLASAY